MFFMATITVNLDDDVAAKFRRGAAIHFGRGKGHLKRAFTDALESWLGRTGEGPIEAGLRILKQGRSLGGMTIRSRDEIYDRLD